MNWNVVLRRVDTFFDEYAPVILVFAIGFFVGVLTVIISEELL